MDQQIDQCVASSVRYVDNFKKGVSFCDICPMLKKPDVMDALIDWFQMKLKDLPFDYVAGIESRGFLFGPLLAYKCGKGFIPIRKAGKLPGDKVRVTYQLEYGTDTIEMQADAVEKGSRVIIIDDLIATGGTARAAAELIEKVDGIVAAYVFVVELSALKGRQTFNPNIPIICAHIYDK